MAPRHTAPSPTVVSQGTLSRRVIYKVRFAPEGDIGFTAETGHSLRRKSIWRRTMIAGRLAAGIAFVLLTVPGTGAVASPTSDRWLPTQAQA